VFSFIRKNRVHQRKRVITSERAIFLLHIVKGLFIVFFVGILFFGIYKITRIDTFTIQTVSIFGGETISHEDVHARVETILSESYMGIIPKRFSYTYPKDEIIDHILKIPRIRTVFVEHERNTEISVTFDEYIPHALWCVYDDLQKPCYFLDKIGYAFTEAPKLQGYVFVRYYTESNIEIQRGQSIDSNTFMQIQSFIDMIERDSVFTIVEVYIKRNGDVECIVHGGGIFLIALGKDIQITLDNLKTVLASDEYAHIAPGNFKYIDVRFDNKVFVNETQTAASSSTDDTILTKSLNTHTYNENGEENMNVRNETGTTTVGE
jgi:hypothetical protein